MGYRCQYNHIFQHLCFEWQSLPRDLRGQREVGISIASRLEALKRFTHLIKFLWETQDLYHQMGVPTDFPIQVWKFGIHGWLALMEELRDLFLISYWKWPLLLHMDVVFRVATGYKLVQQVLGNGHQLSILDLWS